jgi:hypothetical protein
MEVDMAIRTVVCPECDEPVPYGRLSCPACGSLLASVAGTPRRIVPAVAVATATASPLPGRAAVELLPTPKPAARRAATPRRATAPPPITIASAPDDPVRPPQPPPAHEPRPAEPAMRPPVDVPADDVVPATAPGDLDDAAEPAPPEVQVPPEEASLAQPSLSPPIPPVIADWPPPGALPSGAIAEPAAQVAPGLRPATMTSEPFRAGAPSAALPTVPAGSWLPPSAAFGPAVPNGAMAGGSAAAAIDARPRSSPAALLADLRLDAPDDLPGWLVAIGGAIAVAGFLLPWAVVIPFTASFGGYTDRWGLAISSHLVLFAAALGLLSAAIMPNRIPDWIRNGVLPLALGGLLLGIVWPYVFGGIGSQIGAMSVALAALLLMVGGVLAVRPRRHGPPDRGV